MEKSYRIKANVGKDQVLNVNLKRDVDLYEVLSLKLSQEKLYKVHSSDYGVIVGRVLANDAFGIPNAKVSVFIPITDADKLRSDIKALYPYAFVNSYNSKNVRFNTLPEYKANRCHKPVGDFPSKRLVLDEDLELEIYDKYYKFTTVTNHAGDYMIFGVPVGEQVVHVDLDLSDIGVLSQRPTDFIYKGYDENLFESPAEFKTSTNLNELPQIISEDVSVNVYPFWGDKEENEIAITRKDVNVQYKFEPTCVFLGSVITDSSVNSIDHTCNPNSKMGEAGQLTPSEGTIEMIRKTTDDRVEEYMIKGNKLIDGDGVFCYQIPMNLDFVCTDEYGNIVPTDNPTKGIPTRTRVRFRFTLNETENESLSSHKARYLVPNNPELYQGKGKLSGGGTVDVIEPYIKDEYLDANEKNNNYYEFGTLTNDECFRDLLWNKVYSVKSYIPRVQKMNSHEGKTKSTLFEPINSHIDGEKNQDFIAIKGVNKRNAYGMNPLPFNKLNLNFSIPTYHLLRKVWDDIFNGSWDDFFNERRSFVNNDSPIRRFWSFLNGRQIDFNIDAACEKAIEDSDGLGLDFYNDWLNGCLYFPNWYWYLAPGERNNSKDNEYTSLLCDCDKKLINYYPEFENENNVKRDALCVFNNCSLPYTNSGLTFNESYYDTYYPKSEISIRPAGYKFPYALQKYSLGSRNFEGGIIKKKINKDGAILYYYSFGQKRYSFNGDINKPNNTKDFIYESFNDGKKYSPYVRLFSTDIILLGSLDDNDIHGIPKVSVNLPSTTSNIPPLGRHKPQSETTGEEYQYNTSGDTVPNVNGMSWGQYWFTPDLKPRKLNNDVNPDSSWTGDWPAKEYRHKLFHTGLFFGLSPGFIKWSIYTIKGLVPYTLVKSCVNVERICELGVTNDSNFRLDIIKNGKEYYANSDMDGMITKRELLDTETRTLFASLNSNKLIGEILTDSTGYKTYKLSYLYPSNFDGRLEKIAPEYTRASDATPTRTTDVRNKDYLDFRLGSINQTDKIRHFYGEPDFYDPYFNEVVHRLNFAFPLYENSFFFYFGMNANHTAIGEFYKKFIKKCDTENKESFNVEVDVSVATYCDDNDGSISVTVDGAILPYTVHLYKNGEKIDTTTGDTFTELSNGDYIVAVEDANGDIVSRQVKLVQDKIRLNFTCGAVREFSECVVMGDNIDYSANTCTDNDFTPFSYINLMSYTNNGVTYDIGEVAIGKCNDNKIIVDLNPNPNENDANKKIQLLIELVGEESLCEDDSCGNIKHDGNVIRILNRFGDFYLTIRQMNCPLINKNNYWAST